MKVLPTRDVYIQKANPKVMTGGWRVGSEWDLQFPSGLNVRRDEQGKYYVQNGQNWVPIKPGDWVQYIINDSLKEPSVTISDGSDVAAKFDLYIPPPFVPDPNFKSIDLSLEDQPVEEIDAAPVRM